MDPDQYRSEEIQTLQDQEDDKARLALKKRFYKVTLKEAPNNTKSPKKRELDDTLTRPISKKNLQIPSDPVPSQLENRSYIKYLRQDWREQNHQKVNDLAISRLSPKKWEKVQSKTKCFGFF